MAKTETKAAENQTSAVATPEPKLVPGEGGLFYAEDRSFYVEPNTGKVFRKITNGAYVWDGSKPEFYGR